MNVPFWCFHPHIAVHLLFDDFHRPFHKPERASVKESLKVPSVGKLHKKAEESCKYCFPKAMLAASV